MSSLRWSFGGKSAAERRVDPRRTPSGLMDYRNITCRHVYCREILQYKHFLWRRVKQDTVTLT